MRWAGLPTGWLAALLCAAALQDRLGEAAVVLALILGALVSGFAMRWLSPGKPMPGLLSQAAALALYLLPALALAAAAAFMIYMFAFSFAGMMDLLFAAFGATTSGDCRRSLGECVSIAVDPMPIVVVASCAVAQYLGLRLGRRAPRFPTGKD